MSASVELDTARESILRQQVSATQKAQLFVDKAQELRLDRRQWQVLVWSLPYDIIEAIGFLTWQRGVWPGCDDNLFFHCAWCLLFFVVVSWLLAAHMCICLDSVPLHPMLTYV